MATNEAVYFRKMNEAEEMAYMGCEDRPEIAELTGVEMLDSVYDVDIVIDSFHQSESDVVERLGIYCHSKDSKQSWLFFYEGDPIRDDRSYFYKLVKNIFGRKEITTQLFLANDFSVQEI